MVRDISFTHSISDKTSNHIFGAKVSYIVLPNIKMSGMRTVLISERRPYALEVRFVKHVLKV